MAAVGPPVKSARRSVPWLHVAEVLRLAGLELHAHVMPHLPAAALVRGVVETVRHAGHEVRYPELALGVRADVLVDHARRPDVAIGHAVVDAEDGVRHR